jgi:transketolase
MRKQLCDALVARAEYSDMVFITGDLGFMALEPLQKALGPRFINAGVAEQNMVSVAAAMAQQNLEVWVYSIAPFCYARPFEQIRNDVAFHNLPVRLIGNGGGYGYGVMGPTHHAIEDYGVLLSLPNLAVYVPVFDEDIAAVIERAGSASQPSYIRIGRGEPPLGYALPTYKPWRQLSNGGGPVVIAVGPLAGTYIEAFENMPDATRPNYWVVTELPINQNPIPSALLAQIENSPCLFVAEEHVRHGGFGSDLLLELAEKNIAVRKFRHLYARAHHFERYGSQKYLRQKSFLDIDYFMSLLKEVKHV